MGKFVQSVKTPDNIKGEPAKTWLQEKIAKKLKQLKQGDRVRLIPRKRYLDMAKRYDLFDYIATVSRIGSDPKPDCTFDVTCGGVKIKNINAKDISQFLGRESTIRRLLRSEKQFAL